MKKKELIILHPLSIVNIEKKIAQDVLPRYKLNLKIF